MLIAIFVLMYANIQMLIANCKMPNTQLYYYLGPSSSIDRTHVVLVLRDGIEF